MALCTLDLHRCLPEHRGLSISARESELDNGIMRKIQSSTDARVYTRAALLFA